MSRYDDGGAQQPTCARSSGSRQRFGALSGGAFSVRRPDGSLDTDGVVKGWAAQRAADTLPRPG